MEEVTDYTKYLPIQPPKKLIPWLCEQGYFQSQYIVYRADWEYEPLEKKKVKVVRGHCTACGRDFIAPYWKPECFCHNAHPPAPFGFFNEATTEYIISGDETFCPICGTDVKVYHCSNIDSRQGSVTDAQYPLTVHNIKGNLALLCWRIQLIMDNRGNRRYTSDPYDGYVFEKKKAIRVTGRECFMYNWRFLGKWKQLKRFQDNVFSFSQDLIYFDKTVLNGTAAENCKLDMYIQSADYTYPVSYMRLWQKHPNIENLIMQGFGSFINYKISRTRGIYNNSTNINAIKGIDYKKTRPHEMLGISKENLRYIKKHGMEDNLIDIYISTKEQGVTPENVAGFVKKYGDYNLRTLAERKVNIPRTLRYLEKQKKKYKEYKEIFSVRFIVDYWEMAEQNGDDMTDDKVIYPHKLKNAHDTAVRLQEIKENPNLVKPFKKRYKELEKFCFASDGLSIHPARDEREIIEEGKILNHCVGNYRNRHANGETSLFFIRLADDEDSPYYTLEFDFENMKVRQNRGFENCKRTAEVEAFEEQWVEYVKNIVENERRAA